MAVDFSNIGPTCIKIADMMKYGREIVDRWPRFYRDDLGADIKHQMREMLRLATKARLKYYNKTTLQELDTEKDIAAYLKKELLLDISPKSRILPVKHGCEFVGYRVTPHGIRLRKKTTKHIKNSLRHVAELYAAGALDYDGAMQSINSYSGMLSHCNGYNLLRWIAENIVLKRGDSPIAEPCRLDAQDANGSDPPV